jgi:hypothetical protein
MQAMMNTIYCLQFTPAHVHQQQSLALTNTAREMAAKASNSLHVPTLYLYEGLVHEVRQQSHIMTAITFLAAVAVLFRELRVLATVLSCPLDS